MAAKSGRNQRKHINSEGTYSSEQLRSLTMEDGTRVVCSAMGISNAPFAAALTSIRKS